MPFKHRYALERHFIRHELEFGVGTAEEYEALADAFMLDARRAGVLECNRANRDLVRFDPSTKEYGVLAKAGFILTYMIVTPLASSRTTALQYFRSNCQ